MFDNMLTRENIKKFILKGWVRPRSNNTFFVRSLKYRKDNYGNYFEYTVKRKRIINPTNSQWLEVYSCTCMEYNKQVMDREDKPGNKLYECNHITLVRAFLSLRKSISLHTAVSRSSQTP